MSATISSKRYAQAIFQIASEKKDFDKWQANLRKIAGLLTDEEYYTIIDNPIIAFDLKAKLTKQKLGSIDPLALNLAYLLVAKNKFKNAEHISREYDHLLDEYYGIKRAEVVTAIELTEPDRKNVTGKLEKIIGGKAAVKFNVNPAILGGIIARVNGSLIDGSVYSKLNRLKKQLSGITE
jgi:F-type H+-transporting ATPase subunit delta